MKYCTHCGAEIHEEAVVCLKCGCAVETSSPVIAVEQKDDSLEIVVKIFLIIGCIAQGWLLIPLAWCLPITIRIFKSLNSHQPIGTGLKICSLLFVNLISGICLLCMNDT